VIARLAAQSETRTGANSRAKTGGTDVSKHERKYASGSVHTNVLAIEILEDQIFDADTAYQLRAEMLSLVDSAKARHVVVDFRHVTLFGSVVFLALLAVRRCLKDGKVVVCNLSETSRGVFETCRLISQDPSFKAPFEAAETLDAAIARCSA
jgi:anti-anti-sigma regulatory factor